jgi:neutral ceramidase
MNRQSYWIVFASVLILCATVGAVQSQTPDLMRLGVGATVISPPNGTPMAGYYSPRGSEGVLDDLYAKATVIDDGESRIALVVCDLIGVPRTLVVESRRLIEEQSSIPGDCIMISATHTHTGPSLGGGSLYTSLEGEAGNSRREYEASLPVLIAEAVAQAVDDLQPARLAFASEQEDKLAFVRRFWMRDGSVGWNPGRGNPNIIRPVGPIDPEVALLYAESLEGDPLLTYISYAMHTDTTGGSLVSADFPGALGRIMVPIKGPDMLTIFANGACGDINHVNVNWSDRQKGPGEATRLATILAGAVCKAYMDTTPITVGAIQASSQIVSLPLAPVTEEEVAAARELLGSNESVPFIEKVAAHKAIDVASRDGEPIEAEVQVLALGQDVAWVGLPGEIFVAIGLSIKEASPFQQTYVVELANDKIGYVPSRSAYAEGQYEVVSARCAVGSGEMLATQAIIMLDALYEASDK